MDGQSWQFPKSPTGIAGLDEIIGREDMLRLITDNLPAYVAYVSAPDLVYRFVNWRYADFFGRTSAQVIGMHVGELMGPRAFAFAQPYIERVLCGETASYEREFVAATGEPRWVHVNLVPSFDQDGKVIGIVVLNHDLTQRRSAELRLAEQAALLDLAHDAILTRSADSRILSWNQGAEQTYGWTAAEAEGQVTHQLLQTIFPISCSAVDEALLAQGEWEGELTHTRRDGSQIVVASRQVLQRDSSGRPVKILEIDRNITARKRAEHALAESKAMYSLLAEHSFDAISLIDAGGRVAYVSPAYSRRLGYTESEMLQLDTPAILQLIHPDDRALVATEIARGRELKLPTSRFEYRCLTKSGDYLWLEDALQRTFDADGNLVSVVINSRDITDRKQAEAERDTLRAQLATAQRMELVGRLAGGIAHEFNNLLAIIMLRTEMLLMTADPATALHRNLTTIYNTAKRSADLVRSLLGYARKQVVMPKVLDLNEVVTATLPILRKLVGAEIQVVWQPDGDQAQVKIDPAQVEQILLNLGVNARDAIGGIGTIALSTTNCMITHAEDYAGFAVAPGIYTLLTVSDTGCGIAPDVLPHIFEPFFTTKEVGKGSGLGLAAVDGIVRQNGGFIQVSSKPGAGATFRVYLKSHSEAATATAADGELPLPHGHGETVLLVEDEVNVLRIMSDTLHFLGYTVIAVSSPSHALAQVEQHDGDIDLLLADVIMPEMNGAELANRIAALRPGVKRLFFSSYPADVVQQRVHLSADAPFLPKPFTLWSLATQVQAALAGARRG